MDIGLKSATRRQRTLKREVSFSGIGIHTGKQVELKFTPSRVGTGIVFQRIDLAGQPKIPATLEYVCDTHLRSTTIGLKDVRIHTVEHVLAAISAYNIDNLVIKISDVEPPIGNGSSDVFVDMIEKAEVLEQELTHSIYSLQKPIFWSEGGIHLVALPYDGCRFSYTLHYPNSKMLKSQFYSFLLSPEAFKKEIAPCRTFLLYEEVAALMDLGLIKGGSLDNAVVVKEDAIFSKGGLFFPDEMVRHKILDMIGDLSLVGFTIQAHVIAIRAGHASNFAFAKKLFNTITLENP